MKISKYDKKSLIEINDAAEYIIATITPYSRANTIPLEVKDAVEHNIKYILETFKFDTIKKTQGTLQWLSPGVRDEIVGDTKVLSHLRNGLVHGYYIIQPMEILDFALTVIPEIKKRIDIKLVEGKCESFSSLLSSSLLYRVITPALTETDMRWFNKRDANSRLLDMYNISLQFVQYANSTVGEDCIKYAQTNCLEKFGEALYHFSKAPQFAEFQEIYWQTKNIPDTSKYMQLRHELAHGTKRAVADLKEEALRMRIIASNIGLYLIKQRIDVGNTERGLENMKTRASDDLVALLKARAKEQKKQREEEQKAWEAQLEIEGEPTSNKEGAGNKEEKGGKEEATESKGVKGTEEQGSGKEEARGEDKGASKEKAGEEARTKKKEVDILKAPPQSLKTQTANIKSTALKPIRKGFNVFAQAGEKSQSSKKASGVNPAASALASSRTTALSVPLSTASTTTITSTALSTAPSLGTASNSIIPATTTTSSPTTTTTRTSGVTSGTQPPALPSTATTSTITATSMSEAASPDEHSNKKPKKGGSSHVDRLSKPQDRDSHSRP